MIVVLDIHHLSLILPSEQGLQTLLKVLSKAQLIEHDHRYRDGSITTRGRLEVKCEILPPTWAFRKDKPDVIDPEVLPAERGELPGFDAKQIPSNIRRLLPSGARRLTGGSRP